MDWQVLHVPYGVREYKLTVIFFYIGMFLATRLCTLEFWFACVQDGQLSKHFFCVFILCTQHFCQEKNNTLLLVTYTIPPSTFILLWVSPGTATGPLLITGSVVRCIVPLYILEQCSQHRTVPAEQASTWRGSSDTSDVGEKFVEFTRGCCGINMCHQSMCVAQLESITSVPI